MVKASRDQTAAHGLAEVRAGELLALSTDLLREAHRGPSRVLFLRYLTQRLFAFTGCDRVEIRLTHGSMRYRWIVSTDTPDEFDFRVTFPPAASGPPPPDDTVAGDDFEMLCASVTTRSGPLRGEDFTELGYFQTADTHATLVLSATEHERESLSIASEYRSLVMARLEAEGENVGLLILQKRQPGYWSPEYGTTIRHLSETIGLAATDRRAQAALRERIKELTCLYGIAVATARGDRDVGTLLQEIVELLPPSWQFPEIACAQIRLDDMVIQTKRFREFKQVQQAPLIVRGQPRGAVEVGYFEARPEFAEGPFLVEEKSLLDAVARQISLIAERREDEQERSRLKAQLRHADRLATIGQLSAGVAHELNEPLSNILGYAQLALKCPGLPEVAADDIQKITKASLHAREVIRKLMLYARQTPPCTASVNLNELIREGIQVFEARCESSGIALTLDLDPGLPTIKADAAQLNQVMVNLAVNAMQAMPEGGSLTIHTQHRDDEVMLAVTDTGMGMSAEVLKQIFLPFFTTKDVDEGTGLGLAVVHGIVTAHNGTITAESEPGRGSRFEVHLPIVRDQELSPEASDEP